METLITQQELETKCLKAAKISREAGMSKREATQMASGMMQLYRLARKYNL
jgi:hypothetical protein